MDVRVKVLEKYAPMNRDGLLTCGLSLVMPGSLARVLGVF